MPVPPDDDMVVHVDPERLGERDDVERHLDVLLRRRRVAGGVVVHQPCITYKMLFFHHKNATFEKVVPGIGSG